MRNTLFTVGKLQVYQDSNPSGPRARSRGEAYKVGEIKKTDGREAPFIPEPENKKEIVQDTKENIADVGAGTTTVPKAKVIIKEGISQDGLGVVNVPIAQPGKPGGKLVETQTTRQPKRKQQNRRARRSK